jgi:ubiquinone biosynthesis protein
MDDGVFHADPHPGNVLVLDDGRLGLIDFGLVGRVAPIDQRGLAHLFAAVDQQDADRLCDALLELAQYPDHVDRRQLTRALARFVARHLGPRTTAGGAMFVELAGIVAEAGLTVAPETAAAFRTLATLQGTLAELDPSFDIVAESHAVARTQLTSALHAAVREELSALAPILSRLPQRVDHIAGALEQGRLNLNVRLLADERDRRVVTTLVHQGLLAFVAAATGLMSVRLLTAREGPIVASSVTLYQVIGYNLLLVSLFLFLRVLFVLLRPERPRAR